METDVDVQWALTPLIGEGPVPKGCLRDFLFPHYLGITIILTFLSESWHYSCHLSPEEIRTKIRGLIPGGACSQSQIDHLPDLDNPSTASFASEQFRQLTVEGHAVMFRERGWLPVRQGVGVCSLKSREAHLVNHVCLEVSHVKF